MSFVKSSETGNDGSVSSGDFNFAGFIGRNFGNLKSKGVLFAEGEKLFAEGKSRIDIAVKESTYCLMVERMLVQLGIFCILFGTYGKQFSGFSVRIAVTGFCFFKS